MFRKYKKNRKPAQRLPVDCVKQLQVEIDGRLSRSAQLVFAKHMYKEYQKALNDNSALGNVSFHSLHFLLIRLY